MIWEHGEHFGAFVAYFGFGHGAHWSLERHNLHISLQPFHQIANDPASKP
jgi:hypothetical protein